jgi:hypothetical protein
MSSPSSIWTMKVARPPESVDRGELLRALRLLVDPDATHEARSIPAGRSVPVRGSDLAGAVLAIEQIADGSGTYLTLNPVRPDLKGAARVADVLARRHLLIDVDPVRPSNANATDAEKHEAERVIGAVAADLERRGWPGPLVIDSGNGWHLIYRLDLPNDKLSQQLTGRCLKALAAAHDTPGANVDTKVHNASRITKLPGTWARKGPHTPERPCRQARLVSEPTAFTAVPVELLKALAGAGSEKETAKLDPWVMPVRRADQPNDGYAKTAMERECDEIASSPAGDRNNRLNLGAFRVGQLLHLGLDRPLAEQSLLAAAEVSGLGTVESEATIRSGLDAGAAEPRQPAERVEAGAKAKAAQPAEPKVVDSLTIRASDIVTKRIRWLWKDRVPMGFITLFAGRTGLGKSFVTCDLAARITQGEDLPDGPSGVQGECRSVLFFSEDPYEYVLAPRLLELGADLNMVHFLRWEEMAEYTLDNTEFLERAYQESGSPALVVIDPPTNFLGGADEHKNSEVRRVLMHLVGWVKDKDAALVLITHVNKGGKGVDALSRVIGSVAWTTTTRIVHLFAPDADDQTACLFCPDKNNLGRKAKALRFAITSTEMLAVVQWRGEVETSSDDAMSGEKAKPRRLVASEWLVERFREKREWPSDELFRAAKEVGISRDAMFEAKDVLQLPKARKEVNMQGDSVWVWRVPPDWPRLAE